MITFRRTPLTVTACAAALVATALTGCSSSGGKSGGKLSKADFISQADAVCASTLAKINAAPTPTGLTDYSAIVTSDTLALAEEPVFMKTITALVDRSPDAAALHKNWIDLQRTEFGQQAPLIEKLDTAATAKDASQVNAIVTQLGTLPDHSAQAAKYLQTYGLTQCAALANNGN